MLKKINIAVFVSGGGTNLQAIIDYRDNGNLKNGELKLVVSSNAKAFALKRAEKAGIDTVTVCAGDYATVREKEEKIISVLEEYNIDLIILAGYLSILSENFTKKYERRIINVHPSLIPSFCGKGFYGLKVHEEALKRGVKVTGATVHFVNEIPDGGEIIMQKAVCVDECDTPEELQKKVMIEAEWQILPQAVEKVCVELLKKEQV